MTAPATMSRRRALAVLLVTAALVFALDHLVKWQVGAHLALDQEVPAGGAVTIHLIHNRGAAFGLFQGAQLLFLGVAVLVSGYILLAGHRFAGGALTQVILGLILGGSAANAVDRVAQGYVIDYVDLHRWPVFNLADACIVVGILAAVLTFGRASASGHPS